MPQQLDDAIIDEALKPDSDPWIYLFECEVGDSEVLYATPYRKEVSWGGKTWLPYPISLPTVPEDQATSVQTFDLVVADVEQALTNRLRDEELQGRMITLRVVSSANLSAGAAFERSAKIRAASVDRNQGTVTLKLGAKNWLEYRMGRRFQRLRCGKVYGGPHCGYDTGRSGALQTCDQTLHGANGCVIHGDDEAAAGLYRAHPRNYGGEPGINRRNRG